MKEEFNVEEIIKNLNEDEKNNKIKSFNKSCIALIIVFSVLFVASIVCAILFYNVQGGSFFGVFVLIGIVSIVFFIKQIRNEKLTDDKKILKIITREEKARIAEEEWNEKQRLAEEQERIKEERRKYISDNNNISYTTIIDAHTVVTNKLHAFLNYEEVIQTRYYKFKVVYLDGSSVIGTCKEDDKRYNVLISLVNNDSEKSNKEEKSAAEKIREYKKLLYDGIITQEEFEKKKNEL